MYVDLWIVWRTTSTTGSNEVGSSIATRFRGNETRRPLKAFHHPLPLFGMTNERWKRQLPFLRYVERSSLEVSRRNGRTSPGWIAEAACKCVKKVSGKHHVRFLLLLPRSSISRSLRRRGEKVETIDLGNFLDSTISFLLPSFLSRNFDRTVYVLRDIEDESLKREIMKKRDDKMKLWNNI